MLPKKGNIVAKLSSYGQRMLYRTDVILPFLGKESEKDISFFGYPRQVPSIIRLPEEREKGFQLWSENAVPYRCAAFHHVCVKKMGDNFWRETAKSDYLYIN